MFDGIPSKSAMLVTEPALDTLCYDLCVTVPRARGVPWVRITAKKATATEEEVVKMSAGIRLLRIEKVDDDGA